jgi:hypothetical protein
MPKAVSRELYIYKICILIQRLDGFGGCCGANSYILFAMDWWKRFGLRLAGG